MEHPMQAYGIFHDDLTELVELAKIGQRARETEPEDGARGSDYLIGVRNGWNACLDYILGSTADATEIAEGLS